MTRSLCPSAAWGRHTGREVVDRSSDTRGAGDHGLRALRAIAPRVRFRLSGHFVNGAVSRNKQKCAVAAALSAFISSFLRGSSPAAPSPAPTPPLFSSLAARLLFRRRAQRVEKTLLLLRPIGFVIQPTILSILRIHATYSTIMMDKIRISSLPEGTNVSFNPIYRVISLRCKICKFPYRKLILES